MKNMICTVSADRILTITVDLKKRLGLSASRKSELIASSEGNQPIPGCENEKIGLNIYQAAA